MNKTSKVGMIIIILSTLITINASAAGRRHPKNLVKNPKFDQGRTVPDNWQIRFKGEGQGRYLDNYKYVSLVKDPDPKHGKCIKFDIPKPVAEMQGVKCLSSIINIKRERPYFLSVDVKTTGTKPIVWVEGEYPEGKRRSYRAQLRCYASSQGWETYTRIFEPPARYSVDQVRIKLYAYYPPGTVYFDNVVLRELTPKEEKEWKSKRRRKRR